MINKYQISTEITNIFHWNLTITMQTKQSDKYTKYSFSCQHELTFCHLRKQL